MKYIDKERQLLLQSWIQYYKERAIQKRSHKLLQIKDKERHQILNVKSNNLHWGKERKVQYCNRKCTI